MFCKNMSIDTTNDKFLKVAQNVGWQVGSGGVPDASAKTIPLVNTTNIPNDTAVIVTIDRVDANGTPTPSKMERIVGRVSGNNLVDCIRGVAGTAQAHAAGAVVEVVIDAVLWNKIVSGILAEHNPDGSHAPKTVASAMFVEDTGADDAYVGTITGLTAYITGMTVKLKVATANTGACTLNLNSLGAKSIKKIGASGLVDLDDNDIKAGQVVELVYDGTVWQADIPPRKNQIVESEYSTQVIAASGTTTMIDTGLSASITPKSTSSKIMIFVSQNLGLKELQTSQHGGMKLELLRNSTQIKYLDEALQTYINTTNDHRMSANVALIAIDTPNTTSSITYKTRFALREGGPDQIGYAQISNSSSTMILVEM